VAALETAAVGAAVELVEIMFAILKLGDDGDSFGASHFTNRVFDNYGRQLATFIQQQHIPSGILTWQHSFKK
jgi:hypothetical protein